MSIEYIKWCSENNIDPNDKMAVRTFWKKYHATRKNLDGTNKYITEQSGKDQCDINKIIAKYPQRVIASKLAYDESNFQDVTGMDFQNSLNLIKNVESSFMRLDPEIRSKFKNDPAEYLDFLAKKEAAASQVDDVYKKPKREKSSNASSMKDTDKDGIPDKLETKDE